MAAPEFRDEASAAFEARKELGPEYERAVLESFVDHAAESINERVDKRVEELLAEREAGRTPQQQSGDDSSHLPVAIWSLIGGVGGSIGMTAGAGLGVEGPFVLWLGIAAVNFAYALGGRRR